MNLDLKNVLSCKIFVIQSESIGLLIGVFRLKFTFNVIIHIIHRKMRKPQEPQKGTEILFGEKTEDESIVRCI